jgi:uncharacterized protein
VKIIALTDIHGHRDNLRKLAGELKNVDVVLLSGDITHFGGEDSAAAIVKMIQDCGPQVLGVAGNCDPPDVQNYLSCVGVNLHGRREMIGGVCFVGLGGSLPCPGRTPNEHSDEKMEAFLESAGAKLDPKLPLILVVHQPPLDTLVDCAHGRSHVGSHAIREFIDMHQPLLCFCGHIHEAQGIDRSIGKTTVVNPGPLMNGSYAYAEVGTDIEVLEIRGVS